MQFAHQLYGCPPCRGRAGAARCGRTTALAATRPGRARGWSQIDLSKTVLVCLGVREREMHVLVKKMRLVAAGCIARSQLTIQLYDDATVASTYGGSTFSHTSYVQQVGKSRTVVLFIIHRYLLWNS